MAGFTSLIFVFLVGYEFVLPNAVLVFIELTLI